MMSGSPLKRTEELPPGWLGWLVYIGIFNMTAWVTGQIFFMPALFTRCGGGEYFLYGANLWRVPILLLAWLILTYLEAVFINSKVTAVSLWLRQLFWGLPVLLLCLGIIALPSFANVYFIFSLLALAVRISLKGPKPSGWNKHPFLYRFGILAGFISVIFVYLMIRISYFIGTTDCSKNSSVKANMHTLQTMVEQYVQQNGRYPQNLNQLYQAAKHSQPVYWKEFTNPYTGKQGMTATMLEYSETSEPSYYDLLGIRFYLHNRYMGRVAYKPVGPKVYRIYGFGGSNMLHNKGQILCLVPYEQTGPENCGD